MRTLLLFALVSSGTITAAEPEKAQLPEGPGKATTVKLCSNCHGVQVVLGKAHSEEGWSAIVTDMVQRGAQGTEDEFYDVVQYLTKYIKEAPAKININKASVKALETGLSLSAKQAEAIVQAREKSEFKSIDDLKKVPGLDPGKIEAKKSLLIF